MSNMQAVAVGYIQQLSVNKLLSAIDYLRYLSKQDEPLDDFDYMLAESADKDTSTDTITFDDLLQDLGISHDALQAH